MRKECKISMPLYKIAYAVSFVILLSLVRGVFYSFEVGIALEPPMAILTAVFCADTYVMEIVAKRSEIWRLYPLKKKLYSIYMRLFLQQFFLLLLAAAGYGLFFLFQKPRVSGVTSITLISEAAQFWIFLASSLVTIVFWGIFSNTIACIFRNMWFGIGASLILWILTNSTLGDRYLGKWNIFSYSFRNVENSSDFGWICGKIICICLGITAIAVLPKIIEKRR
ncbi:MAG: hypothetical protein K2O59_00665 [Lachnospiraceae bacterium]|nr:hypothetical protein [Lachnospiraceae bacterium]